MKKNNRILIYSLMVIGAFLMLTASCKKDDNNSTSGRTVKDIDGNVYHTVTIGTQVWMVENLKVTKYNDGTSIPNVTDDSAWSELCSGAYCTYENNDGNAKTYGRLYNWYAVNTDKLAPKGWHIPNDAEWSTLITFLGGEGIAGGKLKATGSSWAAPNAGATNESGFTALPGGDRGANYGDFGSDGGHYVIGEFGFWWSSSIDTYDASYCQMSYDDSSASFGWGGEKQEGLSVRCIMD
jgi:uncharacterized protein (TIGR02145 family)